MKRSLSFQNLAPRPAFSLLDAIMGICICACGFGLAFGTLHAFMPKPQVQNPSLYTQLFLSPLSTPSTLKAQREDTNAQILGTLHYEVITHRASEGDRTLLFFTPQSLKP